MERFKRGDHLPIRYENNDSDGNPVACDTGYPMYQLLDPAGKELQAYTNTGVSSSTTGNYYADPQAPTTSPAGVFIANIKAVTSSIQKVSQQSFIVD